MFRLWKSFCLLAQDEDALHNSALVQYPPQRHERSSNEIAGRRIIVSTIGVFSKGRPTVNRSWSKSCWRRCLGVIRSNKFSQQTRLHRLHKKGTPSACLHPQDFGGFKVTQQHSLARIQATSSSWCHAFHFVLALAMGLSSASMDVTTTFQLRKDAKLHHGVAHLVLLLDLFCYCIRVTSSSICIFIALLLMRCIVMQGEKNIAIPQCQRLYCWHAGHFCHGNFAWCF